MRRCLLLVGCFLVWASVCRAEPIREFTLKDSQGKDVSLARYCDSSCVVVAFLGTGCPLARMYAPRLNELQAEFTARGVAFVGIVSNCQDSPADVAKYVKEYGPGFPVLLDSGCTVADKFGALRTPEVFILDKQREVRYRGRIDDQYEVGLKKPKIGRRDLAEALTEVLAGKVVSQPRTEAPGCLIGRAKKPQPGAAVTYSGHIATIMNKRCLTCHRPGQIAPFSVTSYDEVVGWADTILEVVEAGRMPPWFASPKHGKFINEARLTDEEKGLLRAWVQAGCPQGDPKETPPSPTFVDDWGIGKPDLIIPMRDKPYRVPATGVVRYQHFVADPGLTEDRWVKAAEVRPGNPAAVHHVLVFLLLPGEKPTNEILKGSLIGAYAPGAPPRILQKGAARKIPAGSRFIFQMHYTTNGAEKEDMSVLGLKFCDAKDVTHELRSSWAINFLIAVPPNDPNYKLRSTYTFTEDRCLWTLTPHMHMRGKSFRYEAHYPDGTKEILLEVPHWDFNWQIDYELDGKKLMPKGTKLVCDAVYDNSKANRANPDSSKWVMFGEQTWDEMMIGWFTSTAPLVPGTNAAARSTRSP